MFVQLKTSRRSLGLFVFAFAACLANLPLARSKVALDPVGIYGSIAHAQECLFITWNAAAQGLSGASIPSCLRFAFHDGATYQTTTDEGGAQWDATVCERDAGARRVFGNKRVFLSCSGIPLLGRPAANTILDQARANGCPELTAADGIQVSGAVSVSVSGGPTCDLLMGRPDQLFADDCTVLPHEYECNDAITLITSFTLNGFTDPTTSLVVLSGSHNIAHSRVTESSGCSRGKGPFTVGSKNFDGHYYNEVVDQTGREGWLASDRTLADGDNPTVPLMATFARNHSAFLEAWCPHYREMSLLGVNVSAVETDLRITSGWSPSGINPVEPPLVGLNPPAAHEVPAYGGSPPTYGSPSNASPAILNATPQGGAPPASGGPPKKAPPSSMPNASPQGGGPGAGGGPPKKAPPAAIPNASPQGGALPASGGPPKKAPPPSMPNASPQGGAPPAGGGPSKKAPPAAIPNASPQGGGPPASGGPPKKAPSPAMPNASPQGGGPGARGGPSKKVPSPA
eukprot:gene20831-27662_t